MRYRLGEFRPAPDLVGLALRAQGVRAGEPGPAAFLARLLPLLAQVDHSPTSMLEELLDSGLLGSGLLGNGAPRTGGPRRLMVELARENEAIHGAPDLLASKGVPEADRLWAREVYGELAEPGARRACLRLLECSCVDGGDGYVAIAGMGHERAWDVRAGDAVFGGFAAIRPSGGELRIWPRIYLARCTNGQLVHAATGEDALAREGSIRAAVAHCLSGAVVEKTARRLRSAACMPVEDPFQLLGEIESEETRASIRAEWEEGADRSLFGAMNAVSSVARGEPHFGRRLELEAVAGRMLDAAELGPRPQSARPSGAGRAHAVV